ncbi:NAD(P)/FAD-dependent oxidoreductase [Stenomitos frigidus]|uniref:Flavin-dependent dehydrogenase n=1 Tax=Stenomitos frigidus ULC18 TaxID=2107698 RepID=A0A2T1DWG5_9CYAN|nr:flavin-dependent dehydrogenase [Stenomitos frigidus]PSB24724.1 flavin-dependent dehydrogenase [Stenomitos frigidus ULC18]
MKEVLYLEVPTPDVETVKTWLQREFEPQTEAKVITSSGIRLTVSPATVVEGLTSETQPESTATLVIFVWSLQRTTYLKVFRWSTQPVPQEKTLLKRLTQALRDRFPNQYPQPPTIDLTRQSIFDALVERYPLTVKYFQKMPNGEYDLTRVYWWEQRWRDGVQNPQQPRQVVFEREDLAVSGQRSAVSINSELRIQNSKFRTQNSKLSDSSALTPDSSPPYDLIYVGGALGVIHAAVMAKLGYRVLLLERLPFGKMNREWNISRSEFQSLINLGLLTPHEFESVIAREYVDGFHKFFDANNPPQAKAPVLHTPTVLNVGLDAEKLLRTCGEKLRSYGGEIWDETEFNRVEVDRSQVTVHAKHLPTGGLRSVSGRLLVDAMGTASPIAWQLNGGRAFDSVCPTVGAVIASGFEPGVWDARYGDVLNSHGDISRGRQLIWELFPADGEELTFYLFHYHQVHPENPGSLLEMYEDFFTILPEYRRCDMEQLVWKKPTFGYIPGHFTTGRGDRQVAFDRLIALGDAASLQSPLIFTGFGSLVRNLPRLTHLLDTALKHDLLSAKHLNQIRAYQSNVAVTWLFSKGMMVPTGRNLPPERVNAMLNTFFGILADQPPAIAEAFIKDRVDWVTFNRMALTAAWKNPKLLLWIWDMAGAVDFGRWLGSYLDFTLTAFVSSLVRGWFPALLRQIQPWLEPRFPGFWLWLLAQRYNLTDGVGRPQTVQPEVIGAVEEQTHAPI